MLNSTKIKLTYIYLQFIPLKLLKRAYLIACCLNQTLYQFKQPLVPIISKIFQLVCKRPSLLDQPILNLAPAVIPLKPILLEISLITTSSPLAKDKIPEKNHTFST